MRCWALKPRMKRRECTHRLAWDMMFHRSCVASPGATNPWVASTTTTCGRQEAKPWAACSGMVTTSSTAMMPFCLDPATRLRCVNVGVKSAKEAAHKPFPVRGAPWATTVRVVVLGRSGRRLWLAMWVIAAPMEKPDTTTWRTRGEAAAWQHTCHVRLSVKCMLSFSKPPWTLAPGRRNSVLAGSVMEERQVTWAPAPTARACRPVNTIHNVPEEGHRMHAMLTRKVVRWRARTWKVVAECRTRRRSCGDRCVASGSGCHALRRHTRNG